jgi:hypothetical protein
MLTSLKKEKYVVCGINNWALMSSNDLSMLNTLFDCSLIKERVWTLEVI